MSQEEPTRAGREGAPGDEGDRAPEEGTGEGRSRGEGAASRAANGEAPYRASAAPTDHAFPAVKVNRFLRAIYWPVWFVAVPVILASLFVWGLTPPSGVVEGGALGWLESIVGSQPLPVGIVVFTLLEMALWTARLHLPLSRHAHPPHRQDLPRHLRAPFDRARALLDEADTILRVHERAVKEDVHEKDREKLRLDLDGLRVAMDARPFDEESFVDALVRADGEVDIRLAPWRKSEVREYVESILIAVGVALALRAFVIEAFKIPSGSMIPTLQVGDHIFVNKFVYGPAVPFPGTRARFWTRMPPERGDVMVFAFPEKPEQDFIKRVIAIPGDTLEAKNGHPWLNGWEVPHCYVGVYSYAEYDSPLGKHEGDLFVEFLGDEAYLTLFDRGNGGFPEKQGPFKVKPGEVWVMGDNRNNSHDSRMWWGGQGGGVPFDHIKGRALFVWLSVADAGVDWSRMGAPVMGKPRVPAAMHALDAGIDKCLRERPPLSETSPPASPP